MSLRVLAACLAAGLLAAIVCIRSEWPAVARTEEHGADSTRVPEAIELAVPARDPRREAAPTPTEIAPVAAVGRASVEVHVLGHGFPIAGTDVELFRLDDEDYGFLVGESTAAAGARARTDGSGLARFAGEPPGRRGVLATGPDGSAARCLLLLGADDDLVTLVVAFGGAGLEGIVHAPAGASAAGCRVLVRQDSSASGPNAWFLARADGAGNYRVGGLAGGPEHPVRAAVLDLRLPEASPLELGLDEWRRLDFGSPAGPARWSGIVRLASGAVVAGPGRLLFIGGDASALETSWFDAEGRFDVVLPAGRFEARLSDLDGLVIGAAEVSGVLHEDLVLPGAVLHGRVRYVGTKHPLAKGPESEVVLDLEREDRARVAKASLRGEGRYAFFGLQPGTYTLTTSPWVLAQSPDGRARIEIESGAAEIVRDLPITDP